MRKLLLAVVSLAALSGCGLENMFSNAGGAANERPAAAVRGTVATSDPTAKITFSALDPAGNDLAPFKADSKAGAYELRFPSANYTMIRPQARVGDALFRAIVPYVAEESAVTGVDLDARNTTETIIAEAALSATQTSFTQVTPDAYVGDGVSSGARTLIRKAFDVPGPTQDLLQMVQRIVARSDPFSGATDPAFFRVPVLDASYAVTTSPVDVGWLSRTRMDYDGDGVQDLDTAKLDAKLAEAAKLYKPAGCPNPSRMRLIFSVDFNEGSLSGTCRAVNRFGWVVDKPGKSMFFVGWIHRESQVQDPAIAALLGNGVPNTVPMYDDGTHGDEVAGDGIWTVAFDVPFDPARRLRVGYKYTWGFRGQSWTGNEEWPGNSRILEVVDVNGDGFVYRRDVFADEATNKDNSNLNPASGGSITWDTDLHGCGPEAHEQPFVLHNACVCGTEWFTPKAIGPVTQACTE